MGFFVRFFSVFFPTPKKWGNKRTNPQTFKKMKLEITIAFSDYTGTQNPEDFETAKMKLCAKSRGTLLSLP